MTTQSHAQRLRRIFAAWIALGYCCLSLLVPFHQHVHQHLNDAMQPPAQAGTPSGTKHSGGTPSTLSAASGVTPCAACEWEAAITAPALPAFVLPLEMPDTPRIVTIAPRALRAYTLSTSSRGPPRA